MTLRRRADTAVFVAAVAASASLSTPARAEEDGAHGRFEGDLAVAGALGATFGPRGARATADARFRYLSTAGVFATYEDASLFASPAEPRRVLAGGVELRPLFLARWATGRETGDARIDLALDSLGLELGAFFAEPRGASFAKRAGLQAGLGVELPILGQPNGPFIAVHGGLRWSDAALSGGPLEGPSDRAVYLSFVVGWQALFGGHVVDFDDRLAKLGQPLPGGASR
jgi:hypothetical protein